MTREEFEAFVVETMAAPGKTWQDKVDAIVEQWDEDTSAAWGRGVEVGRENP